MSNFLLISFTVIGIAWILILIQSYRFFSREDSENGKTESEGKV